LASIFGNRAIPPLRVIYHTTRRFKQRTNIHLFTP